MSNKVVRGRYASTVTSKYQFTIPARVARSHGWGPGTRFVFRVLDPEAGAFVARPLDLVTAKHELADAVADLHRRLDDPAISHEELVERAHSLVAAVRRFEEELLHANITLATEGG